MLKKIVFALVACLSGSLAQAGVLVNFDADGAGGAFGTKQVSTFDFLPGNSLAKGSGSLLAPGSKFTLYYQAALGVITDDNGDDAFVGAFGANEITIVAGFSEVTQSAGVVGNTANASFGLGSGTNFLRMYYGA